MVGRYFLPQHMPFKNFQVRLCGPVLRIFLPMQARRLDLWSGLKIPCARTKTNAAQINKYSKNKKKNFLLGGDSCLLLEVTGGRPGLLWCLCRVSFLPHCSALNMPRSNYNSEASHPGTSGTSPVTSQLLPAGMAIHHAGNTWPPDVPMTVV